MIDFERNLSVLREGGVEFVVIGGFAMYSRGSSYLTRDLDICYERSQDNIHLLVKALAPYHPRLRGAPKSLPFFFDKQTISHGLNFTLTTDLGDLDLLGEVSGIGQYKEVLAQSTTLELFGQSCQVLSLEGLIAAKRAAGRPRDLAVLPELEALRELESLRLSEPGGSITSGQGRMHTRKKPKDAGRG